MHTLLSAKQFLAITEKISGQLADRYCFFKDVVLIGIQQGGVFFADRIVESISELQKGQNFKYGQLDITFYRDDIRNKILAPDVMNLPFSIENKTVILIDDVLFTGRTIKAALDALLDYGRPAKVELCVLIDRKEHRQFPIQADYVGQAIKTKKTDKVKLLKNSSGEMEVVLISEN